MLAIIVSVGLAIYHGYYKEYFYEDEVLSYTNANSLDGAFFSLEEGKEYNGKDLFEHLYVLPENRYDWSNVIRNQREDAHPPIYGILLHAVSSVWSGHFSKWFGIGINVFCLAGVLLFLFLTVRELFPERRYYAAFVTFVFGAIRGIMILTVFIRMYMLLMLLSEIYVYWHIRTLKREKTQRSDYLVLAMVAYLGAMTHYYFVVFAFYASLFYVMTIIRKKTRRELCLYFGTVVSVGLLYCVTWMYNQLFGSFRMDAAGDTLSQNFSPQALSQKILQISSEINRELFGGHFGLLLAVFVVFATILLFRDRNKFKEALDLNFNLKYLVALTISFYITASILTPYATARYLSLVYPYIVLLILLAVETVVNSVLKTKVYGVLFLGCVMLLPEVVALKNGLFDINRSIIDEKSTEYSRETCLFDVGIQPEENIFELRKFDDICVYGIDTIDSFDQISQSDRLVVYISDWVDKDEYIEAIRKVNPRLKNEERLYVAYYSTCYLLSR